MSTRLVYQDGNEFYVQPANMGDFTEIVAAPIRLYGEDDSEGKELARQWFENHYCWKNGFEVVYLP